MYLSHLYIYKYLVMFFMPSNYCFQSCIELSSSLICPGHSFICLLVPPQYFFLIPGRFEPFSCWCIYGISTSSSSTSKSTGSFCKVNRNVKTVEQTSMKFMKIFKAKYGMNLFDRPSKIKWQFTILNYNIDTCSIIPTL